MINDLTSATIISDIISTFSEIPKEKSNQNYKISGNI